MIKAKSRYSFPGRIYELLLSDEKYVNDVSKLKKVENSFPKYDQWKDDNGFNMSFALAGYTPEDLKITVKGRQLFIESEGIELFDADIEQKPSSDMEEIKKQVAINKGFIARGIARRSFKTNLFISEEFDLSCIKANMEHGLLSIFVPSITIEEKKIEINKV
jgi:HSP20 family molecular chaperone IbpA